MLYNIRYFIMLELRNLTKIYHTEDEGSLALKGISIVFPEKGFVSLTGESGSGKTTLLNVLSGFTSYEEGDFFVDGVDFLSFSEEDLENYRRNDIGFVFQDYHLIENYTVLDNLVSALLIVGVPLKEAKKKSLALLKKFDLEPFKKNKARSLSSGQKQKLAIARAMIKEPKIILCDEPTANLDPKSSIQILSVLKEYADNHLVIVSTHNYEDAQEFTTHFIRIYNGNLTAYEEVKPCPQSAVEEVKKKKTNYFLLFLTAIKNQISRLTAKVLFYSVFVASLVFVLALFASNIDDSSTKILSRATFNNINQNEVLVMRKDRAILNEDDLSELRELNHVTGTQLYGLSTEMNYYYREDIDYENRLIITRVPDPLGDGYIETTDYVFNTLKEDMYIKSWQGMIDESDLKEGKLPEAYQDIVVYGDYQIGDQVLVYFNDPVLQGSPYFQLKFEVVGLLKEKNDDAYFSPLFLKAMDYMQFHSNRTLFSLTMYYQTYNKYKGLYEFKLISFDLIPIYNPLLGLGPNEMQLPVNIVERAKSSFPDADDVHFSYVSLVNQVDRYDVSLMTYYDNDAHANKFRFTDELTSNYVYVGEDIFHLFSDDHTSSVSRVFIDSYPYLDDVIVKLTNKQYDCLSAYRAGSTEYDENKQNQRAFLLILSLALIAVEALVYYLFGYLFEKGKLNDDFTLSLLGSPSNSLRKVSFLQIGSSCLLGFIVGVIIYFMVYVLVPVPFIVNVNQYLRFYHFLIVALINVILCLGIWLKYHHNLLKKIKKGRKVA